MSTETSVWAEYDSAAKWQAARGLDGSLGSKLPEGLSVACAAMIGEDPEAFAERVRAFRYALAMSKVEGCPWVCPSPKAAQ